MRVWFRLFNLAGARGLASLFQASALAILAHESGREQFGLVALVFSAASFIAIVSDCGMSSLIMTSFVAGKKRQVRKIVSLNRYTAVGGGFLGSLVVLAVFGVSLESAGLIFLVMAVFLDKYIEAILAYTVAQKRSSPSVVSIIVRRTMAVTALCVLVICKVDPLISYGISAMFGGLVGLLLIFLMSDKPQGCGWRIPGWLVLIRTGFPFSVSAATGQSRLLEVPILVAVTSVSLAAGYAGAARLSAPFILVGVALASILLPLAAESPVSQTKKFANMLVVASIIATVVILVLQPWWDRVLEVLLGRDFRGSGSLLGLVLMATVFMAVCPALGAILQGTGKVNAVAVNGLSFSAIHLLSMCAAGYIWGVEAAAIATLCSYVGKAGTLYLVLFWPTSRHRSIESGRRGTMRSRTRLS